jgi:hypothetical protein
MFCLRHFEPGAESGQASPGRLRGYMELIKHH